MWSVLRRFSTWSTACEVFPTSYSVGHIFVVIRTPSRGGPDSGNGCSDAVLILVDMGGVDVPVSESELQDVGGVIEDDVGLVHNYLQGSRYGLRDKDAF